MALEEHACVCCACSDLIEITEGIKNILKEIVGIINDILKIRAEIVRLDSEEPET